MVINFSLEKQAFWEKDGKEIDVCGWFVYNGRLKESVKTEYSGCGTDVFLIVSGVWKNRYGREKTK